MKTCPRTSVFGVGTNDADYVTSPGINGKQTPCIYYATWKHMLERCYDKKYQEKQPTYIGCTVCSAWLTFMCFREWMFDSDWKGMVLDKDVIAPGNKIYSPETCCFVTKQVNGLIAYKKSKGTEYPPGVTIDNGRFRSRCYIEGNRVDLGHYGTIEEAHDAYRKNKAKEIFRVAMLQDNSLIRDGLMQHSKMMYTNCH
jgi:hypothetical protein